MQEIYLIRHTTPKVEKGICYGQLDLDITDSYEDELKQIRNTILHKQFDDVYSSPLIRCRKLANDLFENVYIQIDNRIMELNFGDWEGKPWKEIERLSIDKWSNDFINQSPPNGEKFSELISRINEFFSILKEKVHNKIAIVTHSGVIRVVLMKYLSIPPENIFNLNLNYGCVIKLTIHDGGYHQVEFLKG
ncbi:alpha-ribazole phosphatase [Carboxylicivirga caseinilyticus]|uniref:alpha-ribazole phosphatase n=1 Tax=Carboxylicivirga caseinilyticus TaxID=3417572 RepID=UPI003D330C42|nr:alpha-ribazole phosphatase [Marinilabiliaceae bacterium A049]